MIKIGRTLIGDSFAPYGEFTPLPEKPEPTPAEREAAKKADRMEYAQVLARFGWTDAQYEVARSTHAFPQPLGRVVGAIGSSRDGALIFSRNQIETWREKFLAFAQTVAR